MDKKHKMKQSDMGVPSMRSKGGLTNKKPTQSGHKVTNSSSQIQEKKSSGPSSKNIKQNQTEIPKKVIKPEKEEVTVTPPPPPKQSVTPQTSNTNNNANNSTIKELEKKIDILQKEKLNLKTQLTELDKMNNELLNEFQEVQNNSEQYIKEKKEIEDELKKSEENVKNLTTKNEELSKKLQDAQDDAEIYKEESETKDLEMQLIKKKFDDYKIKMEEEMENLKSKKSGGESEKNFEKTPQENKTTKTPNDQNDDQCSPERINELESLIDELCKRLKSTEEQRDYAISYYKEEMNKLNSKIAELKALVDTIPEKDNLIKKLTEKQKENDDIIESLNSQILVLSPANDMYEEIITEKYALENQLNDCKQEIKTLKESEKQNNEMIQEYESVFQDYEKVKIKNEEEIKKKTNQIKEMEDKINELEQKKSELYEELEDYKTKIKILNEDTVNLRGNSKITQNISNELFTAKNIILSIKRKKIFSDFVSIDNQKYLLKDKIIRNMIPKSIFEVGNLQIFDKILDLNSYRQKVFKFILNQFNNDILTDDLGTNPNLEEADKISKIVGEEKKKFISFNENKIITFYEFYTYLLKLDMYISELKSDEIIKLFSNEEFNKVYNNILGGISMFDDIIQLIKSDPLDKQQKSNIDILKNINEQIKTEIENLKIKDNNLYLYLTNMLIYFIQISIGFKKQRIDIIVDQSDNDNQLPDVADSFFNSNVNLNNIIEKMESTFFSHMKYNISNSIFELTKKSYTDIVGKNNDIKNELGKEIMFVEKYKNLIELFDKLCTTITSSLESYEQKLDKEETMKEKTYNDGRINLIKNEWNNITDVLYNELNNISKMKEEFKINKKSVEEIKNKNTQLELEIENLNKMKKESDEKLSEMNNLKFQIHQLNQEVDQKTKECTSYIRAKNNFERDCQNLNKLLIEKEEEIKKLKENKKDKKKIGRRSSISYDGGVIETSVALNDVNINQELLNMVMFLMNGQKKYKRMMMKEKVNKLMEDDNSYINKYINKYKKKHTKEDSDKKLEKMPNIKGELEILNKGYEKIRQNLCLPKILDLTSKDYNYEKIRKQREDEIEITRKEYINNAKNILSKLFGEKEANNRKDVLIDEMKDLISTYSDKKYLVGKLQITTNQSDDQDKKDTDTLITTKDVIGIPIIVNENPFNVLKKI